MSEPVTAEEIERRADQLNEQAGYISPLERVLRAGAAAIRELEGLKKANALMNSGMESVCDLRDAEKQVMREVKTDRDAGWAAAESLAGALGRVLKWHGEFPETGHFWDDGSPMSYSAAFGSNGERDFMRGVAETALIAFAAARATRETE